MGTSQVASPGGPAVSSVKKRRLAALNEAYADKPAAKKALPRSSLSSARNQSHVSNQASTTSSKHEAKVQEYPYLPLPQHIVTSALGKSLLHSSAGPDPEHPRRGIEGFLEGVLTAAAVSDVARVIKTRVHGQSLLLDNPSKEPNAAAALRRRSGVPAHKKLMSNRRRKALLGGPGKLLEGVRYQQDLVPANQRWLQYVQQLLTPGTAVEERILQAELTGCKLRVEHCHQKSLEGLEGIVALSSPTAFHLVTHQDHHRLIPKEGCVLRVALGGGRSATLVGSNLLAVLQRKQPAPIPFPV